MKLGYLRIPSDGVQAHVPGGFASRDDRLHLAQALGFTEFYAALSGLDEIAAPTDAQCTEHRSFLRMLQAPPMRPAPQLASVDGEIKQVEPLSPGELAVPVERAEEVQAHAIEGRVPLSVSWVETDMLARHWAAHVTGCTHGARCARPQTWRVARTVVVSSDAARAEAAVKDTYSPCRAYYQSKAPLGADDATVDALIDDCVLYGTPDTVLARLDQITAATARFGTLTMVDHDWPDRTLARQSMTLFAGAVLPTYQAHTRCKTRKLEHA